MLCDIYTTDKKDIFIFLEHGSLPADALPSSLLQELGTVTYSKTKEIIEGSPLIGANPKDLLTRINEYGYALQRTEVKSSVSEVGAAVGAGILAVSFGATLPITLTVSAIGFAAAHFWKDLEEQDG